jgi:hypothetical protein
MTVSQNILNVKTLCYKLNSLCFNARHFRDVGLLEWEGKKFESQLSVKREIWSSGFCLSQPRREFPPLSNLHTNKQTLHLNFTTLYGLWISISTLHVVSELVTGRVNKQRNNDAARITALNLHGTVLVRWQTHTSRLFPETKSGSWAFNEGTGLIFCFRAIHIQKQLTPWNRSLLEKLIAAQLVKTFSRLSWNPKVHYRVHDSPPPVPIWARWNQCTPHIIFKLRFNIILPSSPSSSEWCLLFSVFFLLFKFCKTLNGFRQYSGLQIWLMRVNCNLYFTQGLNKIYWVAHRIKSSLVIL